MKLLILLVLSTLSVNVQSNGDNCEVCLLTSQFDDLKLKLSECEEQLTHLEASKDTSYLGQVCNWVTGSSPNGKQALKRTLNNILMAAQLDHVKVEDNFGSQDVKMTFSVSNRDLITLRSDYHL